MPPTPVQNTLHMWVDGGKIVGGGGSRLWGSCRSFSEDVTITQQHVDCNIPFTPAAVALLSRQCSAHRSMPVTALMPRQCHHCPNNAMAHPPLSSSHPATDALPTPQHSRCPLPNPTTPLRHHRPDNAASPPLLLCSRSLVIVPWPRPRGTPAAAPPDAKPRQRQPN